jgi:hypothetical protein
VAAHPQVNAVGEEEERVLRDTEDEDFRTQAKRAYYTSAKTSRYKLTSRMLYITEGVFNTKSRQIPLWAISDVSVLQSFDQKMSGFMRRLAKDEAEDVGSITIVLEHPDYTGDSSVTLHNVAEPNEIRRLIVDQARTERLAHDRRQRTYYYGQEH